MQCMQHCLTYARAAAWTWTKYKGNCMRNFVGKKYLFDVVILLKTIETNSAAFVVF